MNCKEKDAIIKELSISYKYSNKDISKILKDKSIENWEYKPNEKTIILIDNYINEYPDCWRSLRLKNSFS